MTRDPYIPTGDSDSRADGTHPSGFVGLRNFDAGIVRTMGAQVHDVEDGKGLHSNYYLPPTSILPVTPPPGLPGLPVIFAHPEDVYARYRQPTITVRRDDIAPAMNRWHPSQKSWRVPALGAQPRTVTFDPGTRAEQTVQGWDRYEAKSTGVPFDITYTLSMFARHRGKGPIPPKGTPTGFEGAQGSPRNQVNFVFDYLLRRFPPYGQVFVEDSFGDIRKYSSTLEAISHLDEVPSITERTLGFALTVRVEAELDLIDPETAQAVAGLTFRFQVR